MPRGGCNVHAAGGFYEGTSAGEANGVVTEPGRPESLPGRLTSAWPVGVWGTSARPALAAARCALQRAVRTGTRTAPWARGPRGRRKRRPSGVRSAWGTEDRLAGRGLSSACARGPTASECRCRTAVWPVNWPRDATRSGARQCAPTVSACNFRARERARNQTWRTGRQAWPF